MFMHAGWDHIVGNMLFLATWCVFVLYPNSRVLTLVLWLPIRIPAWFAFFARVGGFIFGVIAAWVLVSTGRIAAQENTSNAT